MTSPLEQPQYTQQAAPGGQVAAPPPGMDDRAGWWQRVGAALIDVLILLIPNLALNFLALAITGAKFGEFNVGYQLLASLFSLILIALYASFTMGRAGEHNGCTFGKQTLGIQVIRLDGQPVSGGFGALREAGVKGFLFGTLGAAVTCAILPLVDVLWPLWDDRHQALHDKVVKTRVRRKEPVPATGG